MRLTYWDCEGSDSKPENDSGTGRVQGDPMTSRVRRSGRIALSLLLLLGASLAAWPTSQALAGQGIAAELGSSSAVLMDLSTGAVVKEIPLGGELFGGGPAFSPDGERAYIAVSGNGDGSESRGQLDVIDMASGSIIARVPVGVNPTGTSVSPDGHYVYVRNHSDIPGSGEGPGFLTEQGEYWSTLTVIDTRTNRVIARPAVPEGAGAVTFSPDNRYAYLPDSLLRFETETAKLATKTEPGSDLPGFTLPETYSSPAAVFGAKARIALFSTGGGLAAVNASTFKPSWSITEGDLAAAAPPDFIAAACQHPECITTSPDGAYTYMAIGRNYLGESPHVFEALHTDPERIYEEEQECPTCGGEVEENLIAVISDQSHKVVSEIPYGNGEAAGPGLSVSPDGGELYVTDAVNHDVHVIDTATDKVQATWPTGALEPTTLVPQPPERACGPAFLEVMKCAYKRGKNVVACGLALVELFPALRAVKVIKGLYKVGEFSKTMQPIYRLYNDVMKLRFRNGMTGAKLWESVRNASSITDVMERIAAALEGGVALGNDQYKRFAFDFAAVWGVDSCLAAFTPTDWQPVDQAP
jgi:YVTN family beta-propeller protein